MINAAMTSSDSTEWATPRSFFARLHREFRFTLDAAATAENALVRRHFTLADDALTRTWAPHRVWLNPPYGRGAFPRWLGKSAEEAKRGATIVALVPARTGCDWFRRFVWREPHAHEVRFPDERLAFGDAAIEAPFESVVIVYRPRPRRVLRISVMAIAG